MTNTNIINLKDFTQAELEEYIVSIGEQKFRAKQIYKWLYEGITEFDEMTNISKTLREKLSKNCTLGNLIIEKKFVSRLDGTRRYLLKLNDGNYIESVLMKYHHGYSICISSQVGCAMGCKFCASTKNGKIRNLTSGEIIDQIITVQRDIGTRISNIVMMGVGEPFDNFDNVIKFIENVNNPLGLGIGQRHITISTCGLVEKIYELADMNYQITLAISLHATDNESRSAIMPVNKKYSVEEVIKACRYYINKTGRRITFEYTLIHGVNDFENNARALADLLKGMLCHVNLIPVNSVVGTGFSAGSGDSIERFRAIIEKNGISATVRREMGSDISAACGQLRSDGALTKRSDLN